jgi:hypothetical protein
MILLSSQLILIKIVNTRGVTLGCCPCSVVSLLGLALVKAPLVVGRRCVGRLRRRRHFLLQKKRVRDVAAASAAAAATMTTITSAARHCDKGAKAGTPPPPGAGGTAAADAPSAATAPPPGQAEAAELAWLDEMYRVGHWGFGRVSFSGKTPSP